MSEKSEALRLAAIPIFERSITWQSQATIELRRLHAENAELREANETFGRRQVWWNDRMFALEQQRDALLEKINGVLAAQRSEGGGCGGFINKPPTREHQRRVAQAWQELHEVIKAVEEEA
jgi:hypothetical protein